MAIAARFWQKLFLFFTFLWRLHAIKAFLFYPRGGSLGYLAAVAMPLDLPNRNVYVAFNFEANYAVPPNSTYLDWVERWNLAQNKFGIGNNVTGIDGRQYRDQNPNPNLNHNQNQNRHRYTRNAFYRSFIGYADGFGMNGSACLMRTICEVAASSLDEHNGLLGSLFKILFMPSTSAPESNMDITHGTSGNDDGNDEGDGNRGSEISNATMKFYNAEAQGINANCTQFFQDCPRGILNMISKWI